MTRNDDLNRFVRDALTRGVPRAEIESILLQAGWSERQIQDALGGFADVPFPIAVPKPRSYTEAREAFLYGVLFLALYLSAYNLGALVFVLVEQAFPQAGDVPNLRNAMRWPVSLLVVAVPLFIYVSRVIGRDLRSDPSKRASEIRSKLTYLTLFVSASVMIGVLAGLIYNFLGGELTVRFVLKSVTVAVIAGSAFAYYLTDVRPSAVEAPRLRH
jgi:hypothetical protein